MFSTALAIVLGLGIQQRVDFRPDAINCEEGSRIAASAIAYRADNSIMSSAKFNFFSKNNGVASVTKTGNKTAVVRCVTGGRTFVGAGMRGKRDSSLADVCSAAPSTLVLTPEELDFADVGDTAQVVGVLTNHCNRIDTVSTITWSTVNSGIATVVQSGSRQANIISTGQGSTFIIAAAGSIRDTLPVCVGDTTLTVPHLTLAMNVGSTADLAATVSLCGGGPLSGSVTWISRNEAVATVASTGPVTATVTGEGAGSAYQVAILGSKKDSTLATVTVPPASDTGTVYFLADAESGIVTSPGGTPFPGWGVYCNYQPAVDCPISVVNGTTSDGATNKAKNGTHAFRHEVNNPLATPNSSSSLATNKPQVGMGCVLGHFCDGWYSMWVYIDAGYDASTWNALMNMFAIKPVADPMGHVGLSIRNGVRQLYWYMKNCENTAHYACPNIAGYTRSGPSYYMASTSPAGIVPFPKNQWVHLAVFYHFARTNGEVEMWQNGVKIMELTAPTLNTFDGHSNFNNTGGDQMFGFGMYHGPVSEPSGKRRIFVDDFMVSENRPVP